MAPREKRLLVFGDKYSHQEHVRGVKPPCAVAKYNAKGSVSDNAERHDRDADPVFFEEAESHVKEQVHKDNAWNVPDIGMPGFVCVYRKGRIYVKRYLSYVSEKDVHKHREARRNKNRNDSYRNESFEKTGLCLGAFIHSESGTKEKHRNHRIARRHKDVQAVPYVSFVKPRSACGLRQMVENDNNGAEAEEAFGMLKRHISFVPFLLFEGFRAKEKEQAQCNVP